MTVPTRIAYDLIRDGRAGKLWKLVEFHTPVKGYNIRLEQFVETSRGRLWVSCHLLPSGTLRAFPETEWDFGTGAIDTPDVQRASLPHDMGCHFTNLGLMPWAEREVWDHYYAELLGHYGCPAWRRKAHLAVVRANSKFIAYWQRKPYGKEL